MKAAEAVRLAAQELKSVAGEEHLREARLMVAALLGVPLPSLSVHGGLALQREQIALLGDWISQRKAHRPLQHLLGTWSFYGYDFLVGPEALIPRPETEELCERAIRLIRERGYQRVLDLCTGTGCLAIVVQKETGVQVAASDLSPEALDLARENGSLHGAEIDFFQGDLFRPLEGRTFDLILSNPPYLSREDMENLQPEVAFEPEMALYGGSDGLDFYRRIAREYGDYLNPGGAMLLEIGWNQGQAVQSMFSKAVCHRDLSGQDRIIQVEVE